MNNEFPFSVTLQPPLRMGEYEAESGTRVVYFFDRDNNRAGGVTVGYSPLLKNSANYPIGNMANVAVAYCKPGEAFSRRYGREIVLSNLYYGNCIQLPIYAGGHPVRYLRRLFDQLHTSIW